MTFYFNIKTLPTGEANKSSMSTSTVYSEDNLVGQGQGEEDEGIHDQ